MSNREQQAYQSMMNNETSPRTVVKYSTKEGAAKLTDEYFKDIRPVRGTTEPTVEPAAATRPQPLFVRDNLAETADNPAAPIDLSRSSSWPDIESRPASRKDERNPMAEFIYGQSQRLKRNLHTVVKHHSDGVGDPESQRPPAVEFEVIRTDELAAIAIESGITPENIGKAA